MEFFTWQGLVTYTEATLATAMITQLIKETGFLKRLPTRLLSYIVAAALLIVSTIANEGFDWKQLALTFVNAIVVALASNGAFDAIAVGRTA